MCHLIKNNTIHNNSKINRYEESTWHVPGLYLFSFRYITYRYRYRYKVLPVHEMQVQVQVQVQQNQYLGTGTGTGTSTWPQPWLGNVIAQSPRKFRDISNTYSKRFIMVYRMIIDVILHLFIICYDLWCQLPFLKKSFRHNGSAVFGTMPQMCRGCPDVNKHRGMNAAILRQHRPFMSIKSFVQHSGWQEMVSLCSLIRLRWLTPIMQK